MLSKVKVISLFAGIGGICMGFKQAGAEVIWANEIDKNACITYRHNFGSAYLVEGDIKFVNTEDIPDFDILTAGFPCQPFSIAGLKKGFNDERGNLFFEILRILKDKKPKAFLLENVKNIINHDNGNTFKKIKMHLEKYGYFINHKVLNTAKYGNIPQSRDRIYIVGFLNQNEFNRFEFPSEIKLTTTINNIINVSEKKLDSFYYNHTQYYEKLKREVLSQNSIYQLRRVYVRENKNGLCPTLTASMGTGGHNVPLVRDNHDIRKLTPEECLKFQGFTHNFSFPRSVSKENCYKQAGNSVSVPVVKRVAENIIKSLSPATV